MGKKIVVVIIALIVIVGGYLLVTNMSKSVPGQEDNVPTDSQTNNNQEEAPVVNVEVESDAVKTTITHAVAYTDTGFSPSTLTVKAGDTVIFKNQSSGNMWVGSAMHPTHMVYSGTNLQQHCPDADNNDFDQCQNVATGTSWAFTFTKVGSWGYHNHSNSTHFGKITVE